ncbi:MAG: hypothetical protein ACFBSC_16075 [Microcoleaceae cyanobacterium]
MDLLLNPEVLRQAGIDFFGVDVDPNGDGVIEATEAFSKTTGLQVAVVWNVTPDELAGQFISLSDADLAVG